MQRCPVCGAAVYEPDKRITTRHNGVQYFFDSEEHRDAFEEAPGKYTGHGKAKQEGSS